MIVDVSAGKQNYSQRNNQISPMGACATTSIAMAIDYAGIPFPASKWPQPEDGIIDFIRTNPEVQLYYQKNYPGLFGAKTPANEIHAVNVFGVNLYFQKKIIDFSMKITVPEILFRTVANRAVPVSGIWAGLHHVVCVVGFETGQENVYFCADPDDIILGQVDTVLIDDPYGDYRTGYKVQTGNNIRVPYKDFVANVNSPGSLFEKWAYMLTLGR